MIQYIILSLLCEDCNDDFPAVHTWLSALASRPEFKLAAHAVYKGGDSTSIKPSLTSQSAPYRHKEVVQKHPVQKLTSKPKDEATVCTLNMYISWHI